MRVLVVNAGSSSLKMRLLDGADAIVGSAELPANTDGFDTGRLADILHGWGKPDVVWATGSSTAAPHSPVPYWSTPRSATSSNGSPT